MEFAWNKNNSPTHGNESFMKFHSFTSGTLASLLLKGIICGSGASGLIFLSGCSENREGNVRAQSTVKSIKESRLELVEAKNEIGKSLVALNQVVHQVEIKKSFSEFTEVLEDIKDREKNVRKQRIKMEENSNEYIKEWQLEIAQFSNDDLKKSSIDRQAEVKKKFSETTVIYKELNEVYGPFIKNLTEIQLALRNDLTPASIQNVRPVIESASDDGEKVQAKADAVLAQLDDLNASLSSETGGTTK